MLIWLSGLGFNVFRCFLLPVLKYCSLVWMSATASLYDRVVSTTVILSDGLVEYNLEQRLCATLCMFCKIHCNPNHALKAALPRVHVPARLTRLAVLVHSRYLDVSRCHTVQLGRSIVLVCGVQ